MKNDEAMIPKEQPESVLAVISRVAADPRLDVEKLSRLLDLQERVMADQRKIEFAAAMSRLQAELPQIGKFGQAKNSKFAKLDDIDIVMKPLLAQEGFSISFNEEAHTEKTTTFIMTVTHRAGHSEFRRLTVPVDVASQNREGRSIRPAIQDMGSTVSYARRYLLKMLFNIVEKDEDTDGENRERISEEEVLNIEAEIKDLKMNRELFLKLLAVTRIDEILVRDMPKVRNAFAVKREAQEKK